MPCSASGKTTSGLPYKWVIAVGARASPLSRAQVEEVRLDLHRFYPSIVFEPIWMQTTGDKDSKTSLRSLEKTDFFTREIDHLQLSGGCRISIHSAKDLPDPLPKGLKVAAITRGQDPSDVLVLRDQESLDSLPYGAKVGTSSHRREKNVTDLRSDLLCVDIRGLIEERLKLLKEGSVDALVMAEAALIRLNLTHLNRISLPGEKAPLQGKLAVIILESDQELMDLFSLIDTR